MYSDIIHSKNKLPTDFPNYYKQLEEPKITEQGENKVVSAKILWNNKEYEFTWITTLSSKEEILTQLNTKINTMLVLAILFNLGNKTKSLQYNPRENTVNKYDEKKTMKTASVDFDQLINRVNSKIKNSETDSSKVFKISTYQTKLKVIEWSKEAFQSLNKINPLSPKPSDLMQKLEPVVNGKAPNEKERVERQNQEDEKNKQEVDRKAIAAKNKQEEEKKAALKAEQNQKNCVVRKDLESPRRAGGTLKPESP